MSNKKSLVESIVKAGTTKLSFDDIRFYETKRLVKYSGDRRRQNWSWSRDALNQLNETELEMIDVHCA